MPKRYSMPAITLHWLMAILILGTLGVGLTFEDMPFSKDKLILINWHKWAGITVLWLTAVRLSLRLITKTPPPLESLTTWEKKLSIGAHHALYLLMFSIPLSGWIMSSAKGYPVVYFGVITLPNLIGKHPESIAELVFGYPNWLSPLMAFIATKLGIASMQVTEALENLHSALADGFLVLLGLHVIGALKHQWLDKKPIFYRMGIGKPPKDIP